MWTYGLVGQLIWVKGGRGCAIKLNPQMWHKRVNINLTTNICHIKKNSQIWTPIIGYNLSGGPWSLLISLFFLIAMLIIHTCVHSLASPRSVPCSYIRRYAFASAILSTCINDDTWIHFNDLINSIISRIELLGKLCNFSSGLCCAQWKLVVIIH